MYGNVRDLWPTNDGRNLRLSQLVTESLPDSFNLQGTWDSIDGLSFPNASQLTTFNDMMSQLRIEEEGDEYELDMDTSAQEGGCAPAAYIDPLVTSCHEEGGC